MCELFGLSSSAPVGMTYALHEFATHGGLVHRNKSGWGIAYRQDRDAILVKEPSPAFDSVWVRFIESHPIGTETAIAHVRYATAGEPSYENTHPFTRELGGCNHVFAHNGTLGDIRETLPLPAGGFRPIGATDSEHAFCALLERLRPLWRESGDPPALDARLAVVAETAALLRTMGPANFLYSDGDTLIAHAHKRAWEEEGGFSAPRPPGLSVLALSGSDLSARGLHVDSAGADIAMTALASVPLTEDSWEPLPEGTVVALRQGREVARITL
ncbi:MAG: class II glutamine amidotransferase [Pseudomonadales bacterium]|nr:class II glutamine amidotransferase [Pseudomonadales bacterium]